MTTDSRSRIRTRLWQAAAVLALLLVVLIVPPMISVSRYKSGITQLISTSVGRPVRLSSVEVRLLPRPGFVLTDLVVADDPAFGAEPILHANTVTASIRLLSLWRGRLEIGRISVDEASLNLVRNQDGHWNIDSLFRTAAAKARPGNASARKLPYLEATESRINLKRGDEKLPYALVNTDLSFWQESDAEWRIRLKGQPARTDVSLNVGDTGIVRVEGSLMRAAELRQMPLRLDVEWTEAQLGQLSRLLIGSDPGWRGDLTGDLHVEGTPEAAQIKARLRAAGVHRAEFTPADPLDFDAHCQFGYHFSTHAVDQLNCDSPLGRGHIRLTGQLPGNSVGQQQLAVELQQVPVSAALDALRTVRSNFAPGLQAAGSIGGKLSYAPVAAPLPVEVPKPGRHAAKPAAIPNPLSGSLVVDGLELKGGALSEPIRLTHVELSPAAVQADQPLALATSVQLPAGAASPLNITTRIGLHGYQLGVHGAASIVRAREFARVAGLNRSNLLDAVAGDALAVDVTANGPWVLPNSLALSAPSPDQIDGTISLKNANWKTDYLVGHVEIAQATLHFAPAGLLRFDPIQFNYGPLKGSATLELPLSGAPQLNLQFSSLDAATAQAALLGAEKPVSMISTLLDRLHSAPPPNWPEVNGTVRAEQFMLGPLALRQAQLGFRLHGGELHMTALDAVALNGNVHAEGVLTLPETIKDKPAYSITASLSHLNPTAVGQLLGQHWSGGLLDANGKLDLAGYTGDDLASSAKGALHLDWGKGTGVGNQHFTRWTADVAIEHGQASLGKNQLEGARQATTVTGSLPLSLPARLTLNVR